jgi:hypothetical protein
MILDVEGREGQRVEGGNVEINWQEIMVEKKKKKGKVKGGG